MTEGKKYRTPKGRIIGVQKGLGEIWITAYLDKAPVKKNENGRLGRPRVRFIPVPTGETQEEAQKNLDDYAREHEYEVVK